MGLASTGLMGTVPGGRTENTYGFRNATSVSFVSYRTAIQDHSHPVLLAVLAMQ